MEQTFERVVELPVSADEAFAWHARPGAFERLTPPWTDVRVISHEGGIEAGARHVIRIGLGPFWRTWKAVHTACEPGRRFRDEQESGPFAAWTHDHIFEAVADDRCRLRDSIRYRLPFGPLGALLKGPIGRDVERMFEHRHMITRTDLARHRVAPEPRTVAVSGASGLVGTALSAFLTTGGHDVRPLVRHDDAQGIRWSVEGGLHEPSAAEGLDALVHLAGENVAAGRWTTRRRAQIRDSRVVGTRRLLASLGQLERPPRVLVLASAVGLYGDRGDEVLSENAEAGEGFLAEVGQAWEEAASEAPPSCRVVHLRFGVVLSPRGGALGRMLPMFRLGHGGRIGNGRQFVSWIHIDDAVDAIHHAIAREEVRGAVNVVAPEPVTNRELTSTLARVLRRPAIAHVPEFFARRIFGEMADQILLPSQRAVPDALRRSDFEFRHPELEGALRALLGRFG